MPSRPSSAQRALRARGILATALLFAACGAGTPGVSPNSTASAIPGPPSPAASIADPSTAPAPSISAPASPSVPAPTAALVCPSGPLTAAAFLAADNRCYVAEEVSVVGWWGALRADEPGERTPLSHALRGSIPFGYRPQAPEDILFVDASPINYPGPWPDGIHWAAVTGRRSASDDQRACHRDREASLFADALHCPRYLVATGVVESEPPPSALAGCSSLAASGEGWVRVGDFTAYPPACSGAHDVTMRGWFDIRYVIGGWEDPWVISPDWLWGWIPWFVLSDTSNAESPAALPIFVDPARGVDVSRTNRWVLLTGHYADPKAQTCRITDVPGGKPTSGPGAISDAYARRVCEAHFVVTSIRDTTP